MKTPKDIMGSAIASWMLHRLHIDNDEEADVITKSLMRRLKTAGFAVVPRNATAAIVDAGGDHLDNGASLYAAYRAMVAVAEAELIHAHTTQALDHIAQIGAVPTMSADEVLKLTRG
jgi:hypothetical protein